MFTAQSDCYFLFVAILVVAGGELWCRIGRPLGSGRVVLCYGISGYDLARICVYWLAGYSLWVVILGVGECCELDDSFVVVSPVTPKVEDA